MPSIEQRKKEFGDHVWNHTVDPFQMKFDDCPPLSETEIRILQKLVRLVKTSTDNYILPRLRREILKNPAILPRLIQLTGLTRNKITTDLRAVVRTSRTQTKVPASFERIIKPDIWAIAGPYLIVRIRKVFQTLPVDSKAFIGSLQSLNQATWQGYCRQERAKRSGHQAEYRLAQLLAACQIPFEPKEKVQNPLCKDVDLNGVSFDLIIPNPNQPRVCVKATVHTANIGQYGESKDHLEIDEARRMLDKMFEPETRPLLLAFIDGVGFESNRAGLEGVLSKADEFCQFRTLWKAIVIIRHLHGVHSLIIMPEDEIKQYQGFFETYKYQDYVKPLKKNDLPISAVQAGDAYIVLN